MSIEIFLIFLLIITAMALFASEVISFDITALSIAWVLLLTGILTPSEDLSGFSNSGTVTIGVMFVISEGIRKSGFLDEISTYLEKFTKFGGVLTLIGTSTNILVSPSLEKGN